MAITLTNKFKQSGTLASGTTGTSTSMTTVVGNFYIMSILSANGYASVVSGGGVTWSQANSRITDGTNGYWLTSWYGTCTSATTGSLTITFNTTFVGFAAVCDQFSGGDVATAVAASISPMQQVVTAPTVTAVGTISATLAALQNAGSGTTYGVWAATDGAATPAITPKTGYTASSVGQTINTSPSIEMLRCASLASSSDTNPTASWTTSGATSSTPRGYGYAYEIGTRFVPPAFGTSPAIGSLSMMGMGF